MLANKFAPTLIVFSGSVLLNYFRHKSSNMGRTLLGMLMFVWLSMAITPCVMANELSPSDFSVNMSSMHEKMEDCSYCPDNMSSMVELTLCQQNHNYNPDNLIQAVDPVDAESFVLFEIPAALDLQAHLSLATADLHPVPEIKKLSPLTVTGILLI